MTDRRLRFLAIEPEVEPSEIPLGRGEELAQCEALVSALLTRTDGSASPRALLVAGEAGIGKTTLVRALLDRSRRAGAAAGVGHCVDVSGSLPFGPVLEAAYQLAGPDLALPDTSAPNALGLLVNAVADLTDRAPALLVLEDLHWADQYTVDFARAFARNSRARALLVMTYRSDDAAPVLRDALVDLRRADGTTVLQLGPLAPAALGELASRRLGRDLDDDATAALFRRSEGNPLYAEEILAAESPGIPTSLGDLLTRHVRELAPETRSLVRLAAVAGSIVDIDSLGEVADVEVERLETGLREALDANVLVRQGARLAFRHALLRDAVYDDLLATERVRLHQRYARVLATRLGSRTTPGGRWPIAADLAFHAAAAGDTPTALRAHIDAGEAARRFGARADAAAHYESAMDLWSHVPAPDRPARNAETDLPCWAADCLLWLFEPQRIRSLLRTALAMLDDRTDPLAASRLYATVAILPHYPADVISDEEAARRAVALAGQAPSPERVQARLATARVAERRFRFASVLDEVALARAAQTELGDPSDPPEYRDLMTTALWYLGRPADAIESIRVARAQFARNGDPGAALEFGSEEAWMLLQSGNVEESALLARTCRAAAEDAGLPVTAAWVGQNEVFASVQRGQLHAAMIGFEELRSFGLVDFKYHEMGSEVCLARGEVEQAWEHDTWTIAARADRNFMPREDLAVRRAAILGALGDFAAEAEWADRFLEAVAGSDSPLLPAVGAYLGLRVPDIARSPDLTERALRSLERARALRAPSWDSTWHAAYLVFAEAFAARLAGRPALMEWAEGVERANRFGAYFALQPRLELALEQLRAGDRATGKEQLVAVWAHAREMGAGWYERRAAALATRNRVPLPEQPEAAGPLHRLTAREREVLALLADGATDRQIAAALVISPRTASIHVGNILAKLDVPNRGAAAALARDLG
jgi:DNA-binding CsgD family transcriptional regulator